jgi:energy-coupling factor transporter transmembrane protein EcfT
MVIIFFIFFFQIIFSKGDGIWGLPISKEGILIGLFTSWRLFLLIGYAVIFTSITRPREVRDAIIWLFKPIPFISGKRIGLMVSLSMRFFSRVLDQAEEIRLAGKSRFSEFSKNPFRKIKFLAFPILRRSFLEVEEVSFALASRGYNENYPIDLPKLPIIHLVPFFLLLICIIFFYVFTKKFFAYKVFI